jgi:hypothetical protein
MERPPPTIPHVRRKNALGFLPLNSFAWCGHFTHSIWWLWRSAGDCDDPRGIVRASSISRRSE